jgi:hypothetical protein
MPPLTALLHTHNDALRLGRALETLYACDQIVIIDHDSRDTTAQVARQYGALVVAAPPGDTSPGGRRILASFARIETTVNSGWILCLNARESISESLATSLFELRLQWNSESNSESQQEAAAYSVFMREETAHGWIEHPSPQTRLVPYDWPNWAGILPAHAPTAHALEGELLRFTLP